MSEYRDRQTWKHGAREGANICKHRWTFFTLDKVTQAESQENGYIQEQTGYWEKNGANYDSDDVKMFF